MEQMATSEFMNWRAGHTHRALVEKLRKKMDLSSNSAVIRAAVDCLAHREGVKA